MRFSVGLLFVFLASCQSGDVTSVAKEEPVSLNGTYLLVTIDGAPLPVIASFQGQFPVRFSAGQLYLGSDSTFSASITFLAASGDPIESSYVGTYTPQTNKATLRNKDQTSCTDALKVWPCQSEWTLNGDGTISGKLATGQVGAFRKRG